MIRISNLFLRYVRQYYALYDINLEIAQGERVAFIGKKESGKTSLLRILLKLEKAQKGARECRGGNALYAGAGATANGCRSGRGDHKSLHL